MSIVEQLESSQSHTTILKQGSKAKIKHTGQIVVLKKVSEHGLSVVSFSTGGDYFISNQYLEPVFASH